MVPLVRNKMGGRCDDVPGWIPDNQAASAISGMTNYVCPCLSLRTQPALECLNRGIRSPPFIINSSTVNLKCWIPDHDVVMSGMTARRLPFLWTLDSGLSLRPCSHAPHSRVTAPAFQAGFRIKTPSCPE